MQFNKINVVAKCNIRTLSCSDTTKKQYTHAVKMFTAWVYKTEGTYRIKPERYHDLIESYLSKYDNPSTHHTYLSALAAAYGFKMDDFGGRKKRGIPTKGRDVEGVRNAENERICRFAELTGIRHHEVAVMRSNDLIERDGQTYVIVRKGKGGKYQEQLILPQHREAVKAFFKVPAGDKGYLFSKEEIKAFKSANPHRLRRQNAWQAYTWFRDMDPVEKDMWRTKLRDRFMQNSHKKTAWDRYVSRLSKSPVYELRGERRRYCERTGHDYRLDREAVMMVSVYMLAHYREQVTVDNYLLDGMLGR